MGIKYTSLTKKAMMICFETHKNQKDKSGMPYVFHPFHLAEQMETEDEICTALLHDVAEDSDCTIEELKKEGFSADTIEALRLLTHEKSVPYMDYIAALKGNPTPTGSSTTGCPRILASFPAWIQALIFASSGTPVFRRVP